MTDSTLPSHIGNKVTTTDKDKVEWHSEIVDEIVRIQSNAPHIALCLQLLKPARLDDPIEVRFCYYYAKDEGGWGLHAIRQ